ncbi:Acetohydroxy acid synthase [Pseudonocardia sp. Ae168_Ps1]|uniref:thiamine pyrophosphate-binding protein n=1 Tax=unclassified Pseudonocardia TaxID=2619320 RepID=UPI00094AE463|nr:MULTISPECIES: thiamine pyrophosphate-binding protein [unclassified Pseudonocardia]OLL71309.1 Acetohydroxy acid synthase [Pseudonocardia sp. Ae168_Ps1]OLL77140.1 Acetohydroxy acid synthase [Pseudonocardia sp. Ae150A_Ps1]OLL88752.1 Acetohydroxy acid synthase [Pseudonocardia sp. Ae263_Ps1]OLL91228.1 Acetohydroxy acid synthase [Pseudonocardia sp. Ae356_Ps1]
MTGPTVADDVLSALRGAGATTVFGMPGVHNLAFFGPGPGSPVVVRHEQAATAAADGWARRTGRLGAAVVTTGPGATNALTGLGEAAAAGSPVVLVASEIPQRLRRPGRLRGVLHESRDQAAVFAPLVKAVRTPRTAADTARAVREAVVVALTEPRGPVYVDVPADLLGAPAEVAPCTVEDGAPARPDDDALAAVTAVLAGGTVVVWAGRGAVDAAGPVSALARRLGAPLVTAFGARGLDGALDAPPARAGGRRARRVGGRPARRRRRAGRDGHPQLDDAPPAGARHRRPGAAGRSAGVGARPRPDRRRGRDRRGAGRRLPGARAVVGHRRRRPGPGPPA